MSEAVKRKDGKDIKRGTNYDTPWFETTWEVLYYETDRMGIVHHSNYIRWFEYARVHFLRASGTAYDELEADGIESPVVSAAAKYLKPTVFGEFLKLAVRCVRYTGVRLILEYRVINADGEIVCTGETQHAFALQETHRVISLSQHRPALHERLTELIKGRAIWEELSEHAHQENPNGIGSSRD